MFKQKFGAPDNGASLSVCEAQPFVLASDRGLFGYLHETPPDSNLTKYNPVPQLEALPDKTCAIESAYSSLFFSPTMIPLIDSKKFPLH